jgi:opacity protein-like surface antigen
MRHVRLHVLGVTLAFVAGTFDSAAAQSSAPREGLALGGALGFTDAAAVDRGYNWTLALHKPIAGTLLLVVETGGSATDVTPAPDFPLFPADTLRLYRVSVAGVKYPRGLEEVRLRPYLTAGVGLYRYTFKVHSAREVRFGAHVGFGLEFRAADRWAITTEAIGRFVGNADGTPVGFGGVLSMGDVRFGLRRTF